MFEAILSHIENEPKNSPILNLDDIKAKRFNKTTFVVSGSFVIGKDDSTDKVQVCSSKFLP